VKLIAEPWDLGPGGYRLGGFPPGWAEWNARYRDCVRKFWRGDSGQVPELASRLSGSSDIFPSPDRTPYASINFVTCHDGFTLEDLVSYERKHNEANREDNRDGTDDNASRNWGVEGETTSPPVLKLRDRMRKNFLATLALSQGVPMLSHGDEIRRTQQGNNNAYCQDSEISWVDWDLGPVEEDLLAFTRQVFGVLAENPVLRRRRFFSGGTIGDGDAKDVLWVRPSGDEMTLEDWGDPKTQTLGMLIHGDASDDLDERGRPTRGMTLLLLLNASHRAQAYVLPRLPERGQWGELLNTASATGRAPRRIPRAGVQLPAHSLVLLCYEVE
jgi:glycogen operon protein